jgi:hypothetical protein
MILFYKTSYPKEEVNCTEPSHLVSVPWIKFYELYYGKLLLISLVLFENIGKNLSVRNDLA